MTNVYIWSEKLIEQCNRLPAVINRATLVHELLVAYKLTDHLKVVRPKDASYEELKQFHSELYLDHLKTFKDVDEEYMTNNQDEEYGIGYDCPPISNMFELVSTIAGASLTAARCLTHGIANIAINWCGGWHHANRFGAEGFCYINDIVLAIECLRKRFHKIMYIDLDVHHGNGVEDAFSLSRTVYTLSIHKYEPGFYPGTGGVEQIGTFVGKGYTCNVPLHANYTDDTFKYVFNRVFKAAYARFRPNAIVVQCGADGLARDPHGGGNLSSGGYAACLHTVLDMKLPTLLLGGGGYNHPNAARLWTKLTATVLDVEIDSDIPDHDEYLQYKPDYSLEIKPTLIKDLNKKEYLNKLISKIEDNLNTFFISEEKGESEFKKMKMNPQLDKINDDSTNVEI